MCASWLISLSIDLISVWVKKKKFQISSNLLSDFFLQITKAIKKPKTSLESYFNSLPTGSQEALQWLEISRYLVIGRGFSLHCQWISRYLWNGRGFPLYCVFPKQHFHSQRFSSRVQLLLEKIKEISSLALNVVEGRLINYFGISLEMGAPCFWRRKSENRNHRDKLS